MPSKQSLTSTGEGVDVARGAQGKSHEHQGGPTNTKTSTKFERRCQREKKMLRRRSR